MSQSLQRVVSLLLARQDAVEGAPPLGAQGAPERQELQRAARILVPYLLQRWRPSEPQHEVGAPVWVAFCVELLSLAFGEEAPVRFPSPPGTAQFAKVSEQLLTLNKSRIKISPDSRTRTSRHGD